MRLNTPELWNFQRVLPTLAATQEFPDIPVSTREEARESRPHPEEPGFHLVALDDGFFSSFVWKEFPAFPSQLKRRRSQQEKREKPQCRATIPRDPQMSVHSRGTCFPCTASTFTPRIHSHLGGTWDSPVGKPRGKASWESLVGKPRGKASRESHRSLDPREGKRDTAASAREQISRGCPNSRRGLSPLGRLPKFPKIHVSTGE